MITFKDFKDALEIILRDDKMKTITLFCHPLKNVKQRIRITRRGKNELLLTYGKPNYSEREFLKKCKEAKCLPRRTWFKFKR